MLHRAKTWMLIGVAAAVLILALGYLFVISPQKNRTNEANDSAATEQSQLLVNQHKVADLRKQNDNLATYKAALALDQNALPATDGIPDFLRSTQAIGVRTGVTVSAITVAQPELASTTASPASGTSMTGLYDVQVSLVAAGATTQMTEFLKQIQTGQPRAVVVTSVAESTTATGLSLNLSLKVFIDPVAGSQPVVSK
jgi:Tfp pilus assembly protein PilO